MLEAGAEARITRSVLWPASALWRHLATPVRALELPRGFSIVGVGGATLGGSGCTPLALAVAERLRALGHPVAFVTHGYGGRARRPFIVSESDDVRWVGDEARLAARRLAPQRIPVISRGTGAWYQRVQPARAGAAWQAALALAARTLEGEALEVPGVIVVDGLLQAAPERVAASLLVVDAEAPWGSGRCPPLGDSRADRARLLAACDGVVSLRRAPQAELSEAQSHTSVTLSKNEATFTRELSHVTRAHPLGYGHVSCRELPWLLGQRVHVALAIARPERVLSQLEALGVLPERVWLGPDHAGLDALLSREKFSDGVVWLTTHKCWSATRTPPRGGQWWLLEERLGVTEAWLGWLRARLV
ncbi:MAG: tetraacyldisaccharide 4'-kinase [Polyangiaceae bacterium]|nr:tetraacyldisaccharide 4'-kinase [Polyangiaceae bacterium]